MAATDETGAAAIEYGLLIAAIAGVIIFTVYGLGLHTIEGLQGVIDLWP